MTRSPGHSLKLALSLSGTLLLGALAACSGAQDAQTDTAADTAAQAPAIETATAVAVDGVPLGSVPGTISLPPEARMAVTAPFPGAVMRVYVIEGQAVSRGTALALVRAADPVGFSGDLARARSELGLAQSRAARLDQLASEGIIAQARADEANAQLAQARATLAEAQRMVSLASSGPDGMITLRAPIAGRVAHVGVDTGGAVDGMTAPFVIEASGPLRIDLQLPASLAQSVRPGMGITVQVPGNVAGEGVPVGGQILSVAPSIDPETRSVMAKASVGSAPGLVSGQNVMVAITGSGSQSGVGVPSNAVTRIDGDDHVFVRSADGFVPRAVTVVANAGGQAVISQGLQVGEVVATSALPELKAAAAE